MSFFSLLIFKNDEHRFFSHHSTPTPTTPVPFIYAMPLSYYHAPSSRTRVADKSGIPRRLATCEYRLSAARAASGSCVSILCPPSGITTASASNMLFQLFRRSHVAVHPYLDLKAFCGCQLLSLLPTSR